MAYERVFDFIFLIECSAPEGSSTQMLGLQSQGKFCSCVGRQDDAALERLCEQKEKLSQAACAQQQKPSLHQRGEDSAGSIHHMMRSFCQK